MGASLASTGSSRSKRGRKSFRPMSEINVTPFVDVMLVLLIIFMVAAPLMTVGVPIELPETKAQQLNSEQEPLSVSIKADGSIYLQDAKLEPDTLVPKLQAIAKNGYDEQIFIRADKTAEYGIVVKVMGDLNQAGFRKLSLVTDVEAPKQK
ncbi:MAG: protein TolR [Hyphomicrobiales bacterium]